MYDADACHNQGGGHGKEEDEGKNSRTKDSVDAHANDRLEGFGLGKKEANQPRIATNVVSACER